MNPTLTFYPATNDSGSLGDYSSTSYTQSVDSTFEDAKERGIWLFGDSITVSDAKALAQNLIVDGIITAVFGKGGAPTRALLDYAEDRVALSGNPNIVVMASGSNDIFNPEIMPSQINRAISIFGPSAKIIWVTSWVQRWSQSTEIQFADSRNSGRVNGAIRSAPVTVVDWGRFLANALGRDKMYLRDGVHTTDGIGEKYSGRDARNALIANAVRSTL